MSFLANMRWSLPSKSHAHSTISPSTRLTAILLALLVVGCGRTSITFDTDAEVTGQGGVQRRDGGFGGTVGGGGVSTSTGGTFGFGGMGGGGTRTGGIPNAGGRTMSGGATPNGDTWSLARPTGGSTGAGGSGGSVGTCVSPTACGGDVVGTWDVTSSCLTVRGQLDLSSFGLSCHSVPVTGELQVSGSWLAMSDGTYSDKTTTTGYEVLSPPASCLRFSGTPITCEMLGSAMEGFDYAAASCSAATGGGCDCSIAIKQAGSIGIPMIDAMTAGTHKTEDDTLVLDGKNRYGYCVQGDQLTMTPRSAGVTITGSITLKKR